MENILAATDAFVGLLAFSLQVTFRLYIIDLPIQPKWRWWTVYLVWRKQVSALAIYSNWVPDNVAVGIWGGIYLVAFAVLLATKKSVPLQHFFEV